jgi:hypothetical protein
VDLLRAHRAHTLLILAIPLFLLACSGSNRTVAAGFWFDEVTYGTSEPGAERLGGLTSEDMARIESIARAEIHIAYAGLRIAVSERRDAFYRVRVVQTLRHSLLRGLVQAGESRALGMFGGVGAVSFLTLAHNAIEFAPPSATRATIVEAIGKGIGRAAVHEFAHQILNEDIDGTDVTTYEYYSAGHAEQYYGSLHWSAAWPRLLKRLGPADHSRDPSESDRR